MMGFLNRQTKTRAKVVSRNQTPCLLVSFDASNPPLIWQLDLEKMSSHTLSLHAKDGEWDFGLVLPEGVFTPVAHFEERAQADEAYQAVRRALTCDAFKGGSWGRRIFAGIFVLLLAYFFVGFVLLPSESGPVSEEGAVTQEVPTKRSSRMMRPYEETAAPPEKKEIETGVPMDADSVLETPAP